MMANVSQQFMDDLGPLAAIWAGRDQGMEENTKLVNQQNTLEQIANSQQTRDIAKQKLPFEMSALEHTKSMQPLLRGQQETKNASDNQKLNKDRFDAFFEQFKGVLPTLPGGPQDAAVLAEIAQRNGMDPKDSRIGKMIQVGASGNRAAIDDMMKRIALMSEKSIQERARQADMDTAAGQRNTADNASRERQAHITGGYSVQRAEISAKARATAASKDTSARALSKGDVVRYQTLLIEDAQDAAKAGDHELATELYARANEPNLVAKVQNAQAQRAQTTLTTDASGNPVIGTQGGTVPIPRAGPPAPGNPQKANTVPPPENMAPAFKSAGWAYEPDKYDYKLNELGKLQRSPKGSK